MAPPDPALTARYRALALEGLKRPACPFGELPRRLVVVDPFSQRLGLLVDGTLVFEGPVSTALNGLGCEENSYKTPMGWHRIAQKVGEGAEPGTVFKARVPSGDVWRGESRDEDLILTRVLILDGAEPGVNQGPGVDSRERYIYLHGTNQERRLGEAVSHGCVRLSNADVVKLFDEAQEGDALLIAAAEPPGPGLGRLHFAGVAGSGMSALAQFVAMKGGAASGSDRAFDRGERTEARAQLEALGVAITAQDGEGLGGDCAGLVLSTAVEETVPDVVAARRLGVPLLHRSDLLAHLVARQRTIAITGTSGKSTTTAMIFELLRGAGRDPSVITGGDLRALQEEGLWGNAWAGASDLLVIEADESDGTVTRYHPAVGLVLNLQKDHKEEAVVEAMFRAFRQNVREAFLAGDAPNLDACAEGALRVGFSERAAFRAEDVVLEAEGSRFTVGGVAFALQVPGAHNVENALMALAACGAVGVPLSELVAPLAAFRGVGRRFQVLGEARGVAVVDDFGHNPAKIAASLRTAALWTTSTRGRVLAVWQPHGFGPLRFLRRDLAEMFAAELRPQDRLWLLEAHYAGGTVTRDVSSADLTTDIEALGHGATFQPDRPTLVEVLAAEARPGDLVLVMGARDPSLTDLARGILAALEHH